jgi:quinoprotein glucose dehydrogenase
LHGGAEWGGGAFDPESQVLFVNANEIAWHIQLINVRENQAHSQEKVHPGQLVFMENACASCHGSDLQGLNDAPALNMLYSQRTDQEVLDVIKRGKSNMPAYAYISDQDLTNLMDYLMGRESKETVMNKLEPFYSPKGYNRFYDPNGYPATKPPWGTLNAVDMKSGKIKWKIPFGTYPELVENGIPPTGTENFGGPLVTKSGLLFIGATRDEKFHAYDTENGNLLWEYQLPYGGYATPSTFELDGKQYVVILATGGGKLATEEGDVMIAFALKAN